MSDPRKFLRFIVGSILALFLCAVPAFSQGVRFTPSPITTTATVSGTANVYVAVTASTIAFCASPASGVPCVNKATTYTDATLATPCALATQVVLDGASSCVAAPDSLGNWGIFAPPGQYAYTITTSGGASFGPFYVTLGASTAPFFNSTNTVNQYRVGGVGVFVTDGTNTYVKPQTAGSAVFLQNFGGTSSVAFFDNGGLQAPQSVTAKQIIANQGTACTNGELALSAGWQSTGSATVTAVAGNGQTCQWTITTGTTTAANPTVTDTLTNALPAATTVCELNIHGGTHTAVAGENFQQTALSATAPIFTANFTPTAGGTTYFVTRRCGP